MGKVAPLAVVSMASAGSPTLTVLNQQVASAVRKYNNNVMKFCSVSANPNHITKWFFSTVISSMNSLWLHMHEHLFSNLGCVCEVDAAQMKKSEMTLKCEIHYLCECISVAMATALGIAEQRGIRWGQKMRMDFQQGELIMMITRKLTYIVSPKLEKPFPIIANLPHLAGLLRDQRDSNRSGAQIKGIFAAFRNDAFPSSPWKLGKCIMEKRQQLAFLFISRQLQCTFSTILTSNIKTAYLIELKT